jgi:uncharacterized protein
LKESLEKRLAQGVAAWVAGVQRRSGWVIGLCAGLTVFAGLYAVSELGVNSDNVQMVAEDLPSRRNHEAFARLFPNLENALLVVIDAQTPELAREAAQTLETRLLSDSEFVEKAYVPGGGEFFETHGLLYRDVDELDTFGDQMARMQPILAALEQDPTLANLASLIEVGLEETNQTGAAAQVGPEGWAEILESVGNATVAVYSEFPLALSWEQLLLQGSEVEVARRRVLVVHPVLDFESFLTAGTVMERIREHARELGFTPARGVEIRITGNPALNYEEVLGLAWDLGLGGVVCFFFVAGVLTRALRSLKLVAAALATLLVGLVWSAATAAAVVGHLNLVSAAFGVLFIGLGVDFSIHLGMAYAGRVREGLGHDRALFEAGGSVGGSLLICTLTTAIGFFVFAPTDYLGVAELGLIAGYGMFIILFLTLTLFPALLSRWLRIESPDEVAGELHFRSTWWRFSETHPGLVLASALVLFAASLALLPRARFDLNVIEMRDATTESVQTFNDLLAQSGTMSPWFVNSVAPDLESAQVLAREMKKLESVASTLTLSDYVPEDQDEKIEILTDLGYLMDTPPLAPGDRPDSDLASQIAALENLYAYLGADWVDGDSPSELIASVRVLREKLAIFLARVQTDEDPGAALDKLDQLLLSGLPDQVARLKTAIGTGTVVRADLPDDLVARMIAADGQVRIQTFPKHDLGNEAAFIRFTEDVQSVDPLAAGVAINLVGFGQATRSSFQEALASAITIITLLLLALWRRIGPVLLVLSPLALSSLMTVAAMVLFDIPFNFGNIIVIPLLLGIGVDSGIHLVQRAQQTGGNAGDLMDSTTARAVFYSALTTTVSFGTLAFSSHRGMASLGVVLSIGMVATVIGNLIVLPALLTRFGRS